MDLLNKISIAELAAKLKNNSLTDIEFAELHRWIEDGYKSPQLAHLMEMHWAKLKNESIEIDDNKIDEIHKKILFKLNQTEKKEIKEKRKLKWLPIFQKVAAILIVPVIIASVYCNICNSDKNICENSWVEINSPGGARTEFHLPDGSSGWLNGGSKIKFNPVFAKSRSVELEGEAYFDVAKHNGIAFTVNTPDMSIKVLGTKFNVQTNINDGFTEVVLEEGRIEASGTTKYFNEGLLPGDKLVLNCNKNILKIESVDTKSYTAWKDGLLMLNEETLEQGARRIERWYNVDIDIVDDVLRNYGFKATFKDESLEEVIRLLAITTPIDYEILPRKVDENGIYLKRKIIMKLKH